MLVPVTPAPRGLETGELLRWQAYSLRILQPQVHGEILPRRKSWKAIEADT